MLQSIREHTQGWIAGAIISIIILTFALWGIHSYFVGGASQVAASVNGIDIGRDQLTVAYERLRRQIQSQQGSEAVRDDAAIKAQALKQLIDVEVLKQASTSQGFLISSQQVDNYLQSMPEFQVDGQFSVDRFQQVLASTLMTTSDFLDVIKTGLLVDQPRLGVMFSSFAMPDEAKLTESLVNQERNVEYVNIPSQIFATDIKGVGQDSVKKYYEEHRDEFMTPEKVSVEYLELSVKDLYSTIHPGEAALKAYYSENVNTYTQPTAWKLSGILIPVQATATKDEAKAAQNKANELYKQLDDGGDFASIAKKHPGKAIGNGDLVTLNHVPPELQSVVAQMKETGEISMPVKTGDGYVILKAIQVREPQVESFEAVKQKVSEAYLHQKAEEKYADMREKLADITYEHPDSLNVASKTLQLPVKTSDLFTKDEAGSGIAESKKVRDVAFSNDVISLQNNSDIIQINPETVVVLRIKSHVPSALMPLDKVANQIHEQLTLQESNTLAEAYAADLARKMNAGDIQPAAMISKKLTWVTKGYIGRYSTKVDTAILELAFRLPNPATVEKKAVYGVAKMPDGYAIVAVKGVKEGSSDNKEMDVFTEQFQNSQGMLEYELYKQSQIDSAKIKTYL